MYPRDHRNTDEPDEEESQLQRTQGQPSAQYATDLEVNVQQWQGSLYYGTAHPTDFTEGAGMPPNFPVGAAFNQQLGWMEPFTVLQSHGDDASQTSADAIQGTPAADIEDVSPGNLAPYQQHASNLHRTASAPVSAPQQPMLRSQSSLFDAPDVTAEQQSSAVPSETGQPGSSATAAGPGDVTRRSTPSQRYFSRSRLDEENRLLLDLRDRQRLPWREVTRQFEQTYGREYRMPTLQMRYGRLRQSSQASRQRQWTDADTEALQRAYEWYDEERWRIISERVCLVGLHRHDCSRFC